MKQQFMAIWLETLEAGHLSIIFQAKTTVMDPLGIFFHRSSTAMRGDLFEDHGRDLPGEASDWQKYGNF